MAAPIADKVQLPDDSGNTGKKVRTQTRVVGANTVHEHFWVSTRQAQVLGVYRLGMAGIAVSASAQNGTSTGGLWFHIPSAVTSKKARIRKIFVSSRHTTAFAATASGRLAMSRFTFTGTASGASVTPVLNDTTWPASIASLRTAVTGLTVSLVGILGTAGLVGSLTAVGAYYGAVDTDFINSSGSGDEDEWPVFAPGEGFVIWQDTAGTTSDTRQYDLDLLWDEIDTA
jgi:hypothetical protein